jgi:hypothetical protein
VNPLLGFSQSVGQLLSEAALLAFSAKQATIELFLFISFGVFCPGQRVPGVQIRKKPQKRRVPS